MGIRYVSCLLRTNFGHKAYHVPFKFGYIGENFENFGYFFRVYWYTTTPPKKCLVCIYCKLVETFDSISYIFHNIIVVILDFIVF